MDRNILWHPQQYNQYTQCICCEDDLPAQVGSKKKKKRRGEPSPLNINGVCIQRVSCFKLLGAHITEDLSWTANTTAAEKKAQQRLFFLTVLRRNHLEEKLLVAFYRSTVKSILTLRLEILLYTWCAMTIKIYSILFYFCKMY